MSKKFSFTQEDLEKMVLEALEEKEKGPGGKPNVVKMLMDKARLRGRGEHAEAGP